MSDMPGDSPYPENEKCDRLCGRQAEYRVLDSRGYEIAVCCRPCAPTYVPLFEDKDGLVCTCPSPAGCLPAAPGAA